MDSVQTYMADFSGRRRRRARPDYRKVIEEIKARVKVPDVARHMGFEVVRSMLSCLLASERHAGGTDRHPSCRVWSDGFKCFACNAGGDVIDFYRAITGSTFKDAVRELADFAGVAHLLGPASPGERRRMKQQSEKREQEARERREREDAELREAQSLDAWHRTLFQAEGRLEALLRWVEGPASDAAVAILAQVRDLRRGVSDEIERRDWAREQTRIEKIEKKLERKEQERRGEVVARQEAGEPA